MEETLIFFDIVDSDSTRYKNTKKIQKKSFFAVTSYQTPTLKR